MCIFGKKNNSHIWICIYNRISIASAMLVLVMIKYCAIVKYIGMFILCYTYCTDVFLNEE